MVAMACITTQATSFTSSAPRFQKAGTSKRVGTPSPRTHRATSAAAAAAYSPGGPIHDACIVVTGANRGIGLEFTKQLLARASNRVVAACRDPAAASDLRAMQAQPDVGESRLAITTLDVSDEASVVSWAAGLALSPPVVASGGGRACRILPCPPCHPTHLGPSFVSLYTRMETNAEGAASNFCRALSVGVDVVINNAGTTGTDGFAKWDLESSTADEMLHVFKINTIGRECSTRRSLFTWHFSLFVACSCSRPPWKSRRPIRYSGCATSRFYVEHLSTFCRRFRQKGTTVACWR